VLLYLNLTRVKNMDCLIFANRFMNCLPLKMKALQSLGTSDYSPGDTLSYPEDFSLK